jgi:hypothetical protein
MSTKRIHGGMPEKYLQMDPESSYLPSPWFCQKAVHQHYGQQTTETLIKLETDNWIKCIVFVLQLLLARHQAPTCCGACMIF